jgi:hypothetical protein
VKAPTTRYGTRPSAGARRQGAWGHNPVQPVRGGQQRCQGGDHGAAGPVRRRAGDLAAQDGNLAPEHQDLRVLGGLAPREERQPAGRPDHEQAGEADEHERRSAEMLRQMRELAGTLADVAERLTGTGTTVSDAFGNSLGATPDPISTGPIHVPV